MKKNNQKIVIILTYLSICLITIIFGYIYFKNEIDHLRMEKEDDLKAITELKITQVSEWQYERMGDARVLSTSPFFLQNIENFIKDKKNSELARNIKKRIQSFQESFGYENILLILANGNILLSLNDDNSPIDDTTKKFVNISISRQNIINTDFYFCPQHNKIHYDVIAPLYDSKNDVMALLVLRVDPENKIYPLIQKWPVSSETAETFLVRREGNEVLVLNDLRHMKNTKLKLKFSLGDIYQPSVQAVLGRKGLFEGKDYRNVPVLSYLGHIEKSNWYVVTKVDKKEIYSDLYLNEFYIITFIVFIIISSGITLALIYQSRRKKIMERLYLNEKSLSDAKEIFKTTVYSIGDGVIITDKDGLIQNMNPVAEELTGWKQYEAKNIHSDKVFVIVNEDTMETVENPVKKILKNGLIVGLANHTLLLSKNGNRIPIADSGAPIMEKSGNILGAVLVFRDQTMEREYQKEILERERQFKDIVENMMEGFQIIGFDWKYIYVNDSAAKYGRLPKEELVGHKIMDKYPGIEKTEMFSDIEYCMKERQSIIKEYEFIFNDNSKRWFEFSIQPIPEGVFILSLDITERKNSEEAIYRYNSLLDKIQSIAQLGGWEFDMENGSVYWSKEMYNLHGTIPEEKSINFDYLMNLIHPEDRKELTKLNKASLISGDPVKFNYRTNPDICKRRIIKTNIQYQMNEKGKIKKITGTCIDITDLKDAEEKIKKGLEEKDVLIKELYHRTKNNMMVICSILSLENNYIEDEKLKESLKEIENKIRCMALVHQMLYQSKSLSRINLRSYTTELSGLLKDSFKGKENIDFVIKINNMEIILDIAMPLGMVLNELITNSFKYAFPDNRAGEISIIIGRKNENELEMTYSDNGTGIPDTFDILKNNTLGMRTVTNIISNQLQGEVKIESKNGLTYFITIKDHLYNERV